MSRNFPAFVISVLLHVGLFALAFIVWQTTPKPLSAISVPVTIVSSVPSRQQAETPVDKLAVKPPQPIPAPEETPKPIPTPPVPAPKLPIPVPVKPVAPAPKPIPVKTPAPKPATPTAPPDKNGTKKPVPPKKTEPSLGDFLASVQTAATPTKSSTRQFAQANTHRTDGISNTGAGPADAGDQTALSQLTNEIQKAWILNCDVPGSRNVNPHITFILTSNGRVLMATWDNKNSDPVWVAGANLALAAINKGQPYSDLPPGLYNRQIGMTFHAESACRGQ